MPGKTQISDSIDWQSPPAFKEMPTNALGHVASMIGEQLVNLAFKGQNQHGQALQGRESKIKYITAAFCRPLQSQIKINSYFRRGVCLAVQFRRVGSVESWAYEGRFEMFPPHHIVQPKAVKGQKQRLCLNCVDHQLADQVILPSPVESTYSHRTIPDGWALSRYPSRLRLGCPDLSPDVIVALSDSFPCTSERQFVSLRRIDRS